MNPKIVVKHSRIEVNNYEMGDSTTLEYIFSVYDKVYHTNFPKAIEYDIENKQVRLPRGIDISWLENHFLSNAYVDKECDPFINCKPIPINALPRNDRQEETLKFMLGIVPYAYTKTKSQLSINNATGFGKTYVTIATICYTGYRSIIIANSIQYLDQWKERIMQFTPLQKNDMFDLVGAGSIQKILCRDPLKYTIFLASHDTIASYGDKYGWSKVEELFQHLKCSLKVYDEAHKYFDNIARIDFHSNTKRTFYLTATPERSDVDENKIYQLYFKNIPSINLVDDSDRHTHYIALHYNSHPSPIDIQQCKNAYGFDRNKYTNYVVTRPNFFHLVNLLVDLIYGRYGKALIYIGTNQSIKVVYDYMLDHFPFLHNQVGIFTTLVENKEEKLNNLKKKIILSTTKSCGECMDIYDLMMTFNLAEPFKSSVLAKQSFGRTRANESEYFDIVDNGFYFTKKYYEAKKPIFSQIAKSCKDVVLSDLELETRSTDILQKYSQAKVMCTKVFKQ